MASISSQDINNFVAANLDNPQAIADAAAQYGVSASDIASAMGVDVSTVTNYFNNANIAPPPVTVTPTPTPTPAATPDTYVNQYTGHVMQAIPGQLDEAGNQAYLDVTGTAINAAGGGNNWDTGILKDAVAVGLAYALPIAGEAIAASLGTSASVGTALAAVGVNVAQGQDLSTAIQNAGTTLIANNIISAADLPNITNQISSDAATQNVINNVASSVVNTAVKGGTGQDLLNNALAAGGGTIIGQNITNPDISASTAKAIGQGLATGAVTGSALLGAEAGAGVAGQTQAAANAAARNPPAVTPTPSPTVTPTPTPTPTGPVSVQESLAAGETAFVPVKPPNVTNTINPNEYLYGPSIDLTSYLGSNLGSTNDKTPVSTIESLSSGEAAYIPAKSTVPNTPLPTPPTLTPQPGPTLSVPPTTTADYTGGDVPTSTVVGAPYQTNPNDLAVQQAVVQAFQNAQNAPPTQGVQTSFLVPLVEVLTTEFGPAVMSNPALLSALQNISAAGVGILGAAALTDNNIQQNIIDLVSKYIPGTSNSVVASPLPDTGAGGGRGFTLPPPTTTPGTTPITGPSPTTTTPGTIVGGYNTTTTPGQLVGPTLPTGTPGDLFPSDTATGFVAPGGIPGVTAPAGPSTGTPTGTATGDSGQQTLVTGPRVSTEVEVGPDATGSQPPIGPDVPPPVALPVTADVQNVATQLNISTDEAQVLKQTNPNLFNNLSGKTDQPVFVPTDPAIMRGTELINATGQNIPSTIITQGTSGTTTPTTPVTATTPETPTTSTTPTEITPSLVITTDPTTNTALVINTTGQISVVSTAGATVTPGTTVSVNPVTNTVTTTDTGTQIAAKPVTTTATTPVTSTSTATTPTTSTTPTTVTGTDTATATTTTTAPTTTTGTTTPPITPPITPSLPSITPPITPVSPSTPAIPSTPSISSISPIPPIPPTPPIKPISVEKPPVEPTSVETPTVKPISPTEPPSVVSPPSITPPTVTEPTIITEPSESPTKTPEQPKTTPPKKGEPITITTSVLKPPTIKAALPTIYGQFASPLTPSASAYIPAGEIPGAETGKPREDVWNQESLREGLGI